MTDYSWITNEMFSAKLEEIVAEEGASILSVPGVYEVISDFYHNAVLDELSKEHDPKTCPDCGVMTFVVGRTAGLVTGREGVRLACGCVMGEDDWDKADEENE